METWRRPRVAYPGSPLLDEPIFFSVVNCANPVSTLLGDDATLCTLNLLYNSRKAAAFLWLLKMWTLVAIDFSIVH